MFSNGSLGHGVVAFLRTPADRAGCQRDSYLRRWMNFLLISLLLGGPVGAYALISLSPGGAAGAYAADTYNAANNQLTIPKVVAGNTTYANVVVTVWNVTSVGTAPAVGTSDTYDGAYLTIPSVSAYGTIYYNVKVAVGRVISIGGAPPPVTDASAARFLEQATFGPTQEDVAHLKAVGFDGWFSEQFSAPVTDYPSIPDSNSLDVVQAAFFKNALTAPDQLRQRVAFALGQIFVVSDQKLDSRVGIVNFQRILLNDAFSSYRQLLKDVTLSPSMGTYLDMANNTKADPVQGTSPNENYAREILQLFSVGLFKLNPDGTPVNDANGKPQPTYTQNVVQGYARAFTGWTYPAKPGIASQPFNDNYYVGAMESHEDYHEQGTKQLLNGALQTSGQGAPKDMDAAIDSIAQHANVAPFISTRLIQALVKSNPSPAYVQRVSAVFSDNGQGARGDMKAVLRAILLDAEARAGDAQATAPTDGKLREPVLYMTRLLRGFKTGSDGIGMQGYAQAMRQDVFNAPSVFNFYPPSYKPQGYALSGPEFKIANAPTISARLSFLYDFTNQGLPAGTQPDFSDLIAVAGDTQALISFLDARLMHGTMPPTVKSALTQALPSAGNDNQQRAMLALYLVAASPAFNVQR